MAVIEVVGLRKAYGTTLAVDDLSLAVESGEIFGVVGPNGAGKTTTVECVAGLRRPDAGRIRVLELDPVGDREEVRRRVGVQLQESAFLPKMRVREALELFHAFYAGPADLGELASSLGLESHLDAYYRALSGGLKQRLSIALALVGNPTIAILDELTTGLDPHARQDTWSLVESVRARGVTVVVVTHSMEEAERLCDRVAVIDRGRLVACGSPAELAEQGGGVTRMEFRPSVEVDDEVLRRLGSVSGVSRHGDRVVVSGSGDVVTDVVLALDAVGCRAREVRVETASLEQAFLTLTAERPDDVTTGGGTA
ncbi:MAG: ATP-binding cassette domain-containing protein [Frankiales bacterium]|nr:ATP-binding cassette domain-containing protein [Frankiales bacterium]